MARAASAMAPLEMWGGVECTVNRVGDTYYDQLLANGHADRSSDLKRFAALGLRRLRFPLLWERLAPDAHGTPDWSWSDDRLARATDLGMSVIAGLVHHGSGPRHTSLADPEFPRLLADYAGQVAERYPWIDAYTPVNEPLTTARFSGLYGFWHPHGTSTPCFLRLLYHQCLATTLAMQAVRRVNPQARLVQTEDLGKVFSTPFLAYQASFENERRWLSFDLLCGRVVPGHRLWNHCLENGLQADELLALAAMPCVPDVIGINHYLMGGTAMRISRPSVSARKWLPARPSCCARPGSVTSYRWR